MTSKKTAKRYVGHRIGKGGLDMRKQQVEYYVVPVIIGLSIYLGYLARYGCVPNRS